MLEPHTSLLKVSQITSLGWNKEQPALARPVLTSILLGSDKHLLKAKCMQCKIIWQATYMMLDKSNTLSSLCNLMKVLSSKGFVKISANYSSDLNQVRVISPLASWSRKKWCRISMCLVRECWTGFLPSFTALSLSQRRGTEPQTIPKSKRDYFIYRI